MRSAYLFFKVSRAFSVVKDQLTLVAAAFRWACQIRASSSSCWALPSRRSMHWRERAENSNFGHVEPGTVFGGEAKVELMAQLPGSFNGQVLVKSTIAVGAVMVLHELDGGHVRVMGGDDPIHEPGVIGLGLGGRDLQMALTGIDVIGQQHVANAFSQVFLVFFAGRPRFGRNRGQYAELIRSLSRHEMFEILGEGKLGVTDGGIDVGEQEIQGQGIEEGHVDGRDAVADTVGVLAKLYVTGAVELVFDAPMPANADGEVGG